MGMGEWLLVIVVLEIMEGREVAPIKYSYLQMFVEITGVYILENIPSPGGGGYRLMSFGGKNMKRQGEKRGKCKRKRKRKEKEKMGKENEKRGSKRVK
jgi:hypothetical protein